MMEQVRGVLRGLGWVGLLLGGLLGQPVQAADTLEPFELGPSDLDFYLGYHGIGPGQAVKSTQGEIMLGYGLTDRLSAYLGVGLEADQALANGATGVYFGIYGTPLDTDHLDLDLILDASVRGGGLDAPTFTPALELNLDSSPDMRGVGGYLKVGVPLYGEPLDRTGLGQPSHHLTYALETTLGAYARPRERHQLLVEVDFGLDREAGAFRWGGVALGYNVGVLESLELINQVYLERLEEGTGGPAFSAGVTVGFIATLPVAGGK